MKVLFATDALPASLRAGELLAKLGDRDRIEVTVLSVTPAGIPTLAQLPLHLDDLDTRRAQTIEIVDAAVAHLRAAGFTAAGATGEGSPGREIVNAVERDWYDLTVVGGGSSTWLGNRLLGSVSTYLLHSSPSSVLVVHELVTQRDAVRVLLGTDGSRSADRALQWLSGFADRARCEVTVAAVAPTSEGLLGAPAARDEVQRRIDERAHHHARAAATMLRDAGFRAEPVVLHGHPTAQLLERAHTGDFDLVAVGSRGVGAFRRTLLGSASDEVARHARAALVARRFVT